MSEERKRRLLRPRPLGLYHERTRRRGVNPFVYWPVRLVVKNFILAYFRLRRLGREHIPDGGVVLAAASSTRSPSAAASAGRSTSSPSRSCSGTRSSDGS